MTQLVSIELKPLVKIRNWNRDCINPAKYSPTAHGAPCPIAPVVANFYATCLEAVPSARWPGRCARLAADPEVRLRRRIAQRDRVLRGDMTPTWTPAEQAAPVGARMNEPRPEEVAGRSDEGVDV